MYFGDDLCCVECESYCLACLFVGNIEVGAKVGFAEDDVDFVVVRQDDVAVLVVVKVCALVVTYVPIAQVGLAGSDLEAVVAVEGAQVEFCVNLHVRRAEHYLGEVLVVTGQDNVV